MLIPSNRGHRPFIVRYSRVIYNRIKISSVGSGTFWNTKRYNLLTRIESADISHVKCYTHGRESKGLGLVPFLVINRWQPILRC